MQLLNQLIRLLSISLILGLASCSKWYNANQLIQHRETDYLKARSIAPLKIPPKTVTEPFKEKYPIPPASPQNKNKTMQVDLTPPELNADKT